MKRHELTKRKMMFEEAKNKTPFRSAPLISNWTAEEADFLVHSYMIYGGHNNAEAIEERKKKIGE
jgi:hypothetical protein